MSIIKNDVQALRDSINESVTEVTDEGIKSAVAQGVMDDSEGLFLQRELNFLQARAYETKYPAYKAKTIFAKDAEVSPRGQNSYTYKLNAMTGEAGIGSLAGEIPLADVKGTPKTATIVPIKLGTSYDVAEIDAAMKAGMPLAQYKMDSLIKGLERTQNSLAWTGNTEFGINGFLDNTSNGIPLVTGSAWGDMSGVDIADEIITHMNTAFDNFQEEVTELYLSPEYYKRLDRGYNSSSFATGMTIKNWLLQNTSLNVIDFVPELDGAGTDGVDRMFFLNGSPERRPTFVYEENDFMPAQPKGLSFLIPAYAYNGGVKVVYPEAHLFVDITADA